MSADDLATVFNSGAAEFTGLTPQVWGPAGQSLVFQLRLQPGDAVLDVCSGAGASALPAAAAVGPTGLVHAVDLADDLLEEGRLVASDRALHNVDFVRADATTWEPPSTVPEAGYDALSSSYGVFFLPHMDDSVNRLVNLVRPGGKIGLTTWRRGAHEDYARAYFEVLARHVPGIAAEDHRPGPDDPVRRLDSPDALGTWLTGFGAVDVEINELPNWLPATPELAWRLVLGSAFRGPLIGVDAGTVEAIRLEFLTLLTERDVETLDLGTLVATAVVDRRP
ncbi:methyltransferase domain-containing protein [Rhodococcus spelaei]|uniref:Methyltransferase domain-containing protein n=1 Tax=Rhodococcus spelaei TaxID=2546320 RepID=A0A541BAS7_9NOCA|nr:class I SAM-dependent methyltransferase [Rhodococcus spelaei]TQF69445.1 methyltransferase domain-containing protein [Rhodococcus spelaei]